MERFFDTVDQDRLMNLVARKVADEDVVSLVRKFLRSGIQIDEQYKKMEIGTPQEGPIFKHHNQ